MILSCRMRKCTGIAFVLLTQKTVGIITFDLICGIRNVFRVFLRLRQIDCNVNLSVWRLCLPFFIFYNPVGADIICVLTKLIIKIRRFLRTLCIQFLKLFSHTGRRRCYQSHNLCIKQISVCDGVLLQNPFFNRIVHHVVQDKMQRSYFLALPLKAV